MTNNDSPASQQNMSLALAEQLFCAKDAYTSLKPSHSSKEKEDFIVVFNDIVQLVKGNNQPQLTTRTPMLIEKINADFNLRRIYIQLIKQCQFAESAQQVAASSGELSYERITEHFSLKFKPDPSQLSQVYVILTIFNPAEHHENSTISLHVTLDEQIDCLLFPALLDGRSQILMEMDEMHFRLLRNENSHLYLM